MSQQQTQTAASSKGIRLLSRTDQGGRPDGVQIILHKGHAFIGHMFADGFSVVDVRDPLKPKTVAFVAAPKNTRSHHLQIAGDILMAVNGPNIWAMQQYASQQDYYAKSLIDAVATEQPFAAGIRISDVRLADLDLEAHRSVRLRIGVKKNARHPGGVNIFGRGFGNYDQDIVLRLHTRR